MHATIKYDEVWKVDSKVIRLVMWALKTKERPVHMLIMT